MSQCESQAQITSPACQKRALRLVRAELPGAVVPMVTELVIGN